MVKSPSIDLATLAAFVRARLYEDEHQCVCLEWPRNACGGPWCDPDCAVCSGGNAHTKDPVVNAWTETAHQILVRCTQVDFCEATVDVLRILALHYAHHRDWQEAWRP